MGLDLLDGKYRKILDLGTGSGVLIPSLVGLASMVVGLDRHAKLGGVKEDMESLELLDFHLVRGDACHLPFPRESFDLVLSMSLLEHLHDVERAVRGIWEVVKRDGTVVVGFPVENRMTQLRYLYFERRYGSHPNTHVSSYREIQKALEEYFIIEDSKRLVPFAPIALSLYWALKCSPRRIKAGLER
jgi:ubiquinone/menaquinone biosynthesis C-methylase UbiE